MLGSIARRSVVLSSRRSATKTTECPVSCYFAKRQRTDGERPPQGTPLIGGPKS
jgi:hypothetical protein